MSYKPQPLHPFTRAADRGWPGACLGKHPYLCRHWPFLALFSCFLGGCHGLYVKDLVLATVPIQLRPVEVGKEVRAASDALQAKQRPGLDAAGEATEGGTIGCEVSFLAGCKGWVIMHITLYIYTPKRTFRNGLYPNISRQPEVRGFPEWVLPALSGTERPSRRVHNTHALREIHIKCFY